MTIKNENSRDAVPPTSGYSALPLHVIIIMLSHAILVLRLPLDTELTNDITLFLYPCFYLLLPSPRGPVICLAKKENRNPKSFDLTFILSISWF
jgi:hypothetical protein